ncbi:hypothetical protein ACGFX4_18270 [Kitasatospora sp. NPDC048365]|uniref:hypothetical protein n=1 Tax=Kitasatospora sp. NPDC048365 TaxID=3364050 RepID=UPI00371873B2
MPHLHRSVLARAAAAALALGVAFGAETAVEDALARRGAERAQHDEYVCHQMTRLAGEVRASRSESDGRPPLGGMVPPSRCAAAARGR